GVPATADRSSGSYLNNRWLAKICRVLGRERPAITTSWEAPTLSLLLADRNIVFAFTQHRLELAGFNPASHRHIGNIKAASVFDDGEPLLGHGDNLLVCLGG